MIRVKVWSDMVYVWYPLVMQAHVWVWDNVVGYQIRKHRSWNVRWNASCLQVYANLP